MPPVICQNGPRLNKLRHVPQCAMRKPSAFSFQLSAFARHEMVAAWKEYRGTVIQCAARKPSAVSSQLSAFERHEMVAACNEYRGILVQCAARKLSAVSLQLSAFERHEIVVACKEHGGTVIPSTVEYILACPAGRQPGPGVRTMSRGREGAVPIGSCLNVRYRKGGQIHWAARELVESRLRASSARPGKLKLIPRHSPGRGR
jgi:nitrate reductase NapAB chaperone NapD